MGCNHHSNYVNGIGHIFFAILEGRGNILVASSLAKPRHCLQMNIALDKNNHREIWSCIFSLFFPSTVPYTGKSRRESSLCHHPAGA
jgi:hypothetical protein